MTTLESLEAERQALLQEISRIGEVRPGNLYAYYRKCGKPTCHCAQPDDPGHFGWQLTRKDCNQKTIQHSIPLHALEATREQVEEYGRLRELVRRFAEVSDRLCQARIRVGRGQKKTAARSRKTR